jgi:RNA polymerase sigma factor (sigma-70 family)
LIEADLDALWSFGYVRRRLATPVWIWGVVEEGGRIVSGEIGAKKRRAYRPGVEGLEVLRLLSGVAQAPIDVAIEHEALASPVETVEAPSIASSTWDAALVASQLDGLLGTSRDHTDDADLSAGLAQLDRYLARAWFRAGITPQQHDDCTQGVYTTLLQTFGRDRFDQLLSEVGQFGIKDVLSRETADGPDFFRAIDTVKKRAQRERAFQPLDTIDVAAINKSDDSSSDLKSTLQEAILSSLSPREAALIQATLQGETPAEIAQQWGIAPKTVSNEKTRAFQKLRDHLVSDYN